MIYSLLHYQTEIKLPDTLARIVGKDSIIIGGQGSYLESVEVVLNSDTWSVKGDSTGSYIHTFNGDKTGEVHLTINQVCKESKLFHKLMISYHLSNLNKFIENQIFTEIIVRNSATNETIAKCKDCVIKKVVDKKFSNEAQNETWNFVCGEVDVYPL